MTMVFSQKKMIGKIKKARAHTRTGFFQKKLKPKHLIPPTNPHGQ